MTQSITIEQVNLLDLPSMPLVEKHLFPSTPCIYFVVTPECEVLYIGRAVNLKSRWISHHRYEALNIIDGITVVWMEVRDIQQLSEYERQAIARFKPRLNNSPVSIQASGTHLSIKEVDLPNFIAELKSEILRELGITCRASGVQFCKEMFRLGITAEKSSKESSDYNQTRYSLGEFAVHHAKSLMSLFFTRIEKSVDSSITKVLQKIESEK